MALLRGINVGGKNLVGMPDLAAAFAAAGHEDVSTYLASGNVLFRADPATGPALEDALGRMPQERFGLPSCLAELLGAG